MHLPWRVNVENDANIAESLTKRSIQGGPKESSRLPDYHMILLKPVHVAKLVIGFK